MRLGPPKREALSGLLRPNSGLLGQGVRFALSGCIVAAVYLLTTSTLALVLGLPFQAALALGFALATGVHFTLQRVFVWAHRDAFALPLPRQLVRYLPVVGFQYTVTALSTSLLPGPLGLPTELVYLATAVLLTASNFVIFRNGVFHATREPVAGLLHPPP
ncbi:MAG TPA: GtrA family protein [Solirubrobacteraceae bacterium]|nr:GtrA family protein [Solirubrobacteraceae bacterium]